MDIESWKRREKLVTGLKRDTSLDVVMQKFNGVEDLTSHRQFEIAWTLLCTLVNSSAEVALGPRRSDEISPLRGPNRLRSRCSVPSWVCPECEVGRFLLGRGEKTTSRSWQFFD